MELECRIQSSDKNGFKKKQSNCQKAKYTKNV